VSFFLHSGSLFFVIPAKAGIHWADIVTAEAWTPAFAGVTIEGRKNPLPKSGTTLPIAPG
jgi:hypothetical protein